VLNVVDFGVFVDIGMHDSGMVHISQLSRRFVRDPHDLVSVGQIVRVWVLEIDKARRRVSLTMIPPGPPPGQRRAERPPADEQRQRPQGQAPGGRPGRPGQRAGSQRAGGERAASPAAGNGGAAPEGRSGGPRQGGGQRPGGRQPGGGRGDQRDRPPAAKPRPQLGGRDLSDPPKRVYESRAARESKPLTDAMRQGREPLRTFGDLKQFFEKPAPPVAAQPEADAPPAGVVPGEAPGAVEHLPPETAREVPLNESQPEAGYLPPTDKREEESTAADQRTPDPQGPVNGGDGHGGPPAG
jgi:uncharacterized protein